MGENKTLVTSLLGKLPIKMGKISMYMPKIKVVGPTVRAAGYISIQKVAPLYQKKCITVFIWPLLLQMAFLWRRKRRPFGAKEGKDSDALFLIQRSNFLVTSGRGTHRQTNIQTNGTLGNILLRPTLSIIIQFGTLEGSIGVTLKSCVTRSPRLEASVALWEDHFKALHMSSCRWNGSPQRGGMWQYIDIECNSFLVATFQNKQYISVIMELSKSAWSLIWKMYTVVRSIGIITIEWKLWKNIKYQG